MHKDPERVRAKLGPRRIRRYTPAVTRVEEWTRAETGVGAAIAAGNQALKGIWALLVEAARTRLSTRISEIGSGVNLAGTRFQDPSEA